MAYEKIFWLDDNPNFLAALEAALDSARSSLDIRAFMGRTTFAHDFREGTLLTRRPFDLYVLDADFPHVIPQAQRDDNARYLTGVALGRKPRAPKIRSLPAVNKFAQFFNDNLSGDQNVVVLSDSREAIGRAYDLRIPFYSTQLGTKAIEQHLDRKVGVPNFASWKHGSLADFVREYLL